MFDPTFKSTLIEVLPPIHIEPPVLVDPELNEFEETERFPPISSVPAADTQVPKCVEKEVELDPETTESPRTLKEFMEPTNPFPLTLSSKASKLSPADKQEPNKPDPIALTLSPNLAYERIDK